MSRLHRGVVSVLAIVALTIGAVAGCDYGEDEGIDEEPVEEEEAEPTEPEGQRAAAGADTLEAGADTMEADADTMEAGADAAGAAFTEVDFGDLLENPAEYVGQKIQGTTTVRKAISDKLFYVGDSEDARLLAGFGPEGESPEDLSEGMRVRIKGQLLTEAKADERIGGQFGKKARKTLRDHPHVLVVTKAGGLDVLEQDQQTESGAESFGTFDEWDANDDDKVSRDEFERGLADKEIFDNLDADDDDNLSRDEFDGWILMSWDADQDNEITKKEFQRGTEQWTGVEWGEFGKWDTDADGALSESEVQNGLGKTDVFDSWDADDDDQIEMDEFQSGLFDTWNTDGETLGADEWGWGTE